VYIFLGKNMSVDVGLATINLLVVYVGQILCIHFFVSSTKFFDHFASILGTLFEKKVHKIQKKDLVIGIVNSH